MEISKQIRKKRTDAGLQQKELADKLHVSQRTISSWEVGRTEPNMGMVNKMCEIFGCSLSELVGRYNEPDFIVYTPDGKDILATIERNMESLSPKQLSRIKAYAEYLMQKNDNE